MIRRISFQGWKTVFISTIMMVSTTTSASSGEDPNPGGDDKVQTIAGCQIFPDDNPWNTPVDQWALHPKSNDYISYIGANDPLHPDFGTEWNGSDLGIPYNIIPDNQPFVDVTFKYYDETDPLALDSPVKPYPIPDNPLIEGGDDEHILLVRQGSCILYELYDAKKDASGDWTAGSGAIWHLDQNEVRPAGVTSADAAGLAILPGLIRYDEVFGDTANGVEAGINHALRITLSQIQSTYIPPASHSDGQAGTDPNYPPMGSRLRLKAGFDISGFDEPLQVILRAMKQYGVIVTDTGGDMFVSGTHDDRWDDSQLHKLEGVKASDFEVVLNSNNQPGTPDVTPPDQPTNLTAENITQPQVQLSWSASTDDVGVTGYNVYRDGINIATVTSTTYTDMELTVSTTYQYQVSAVDAAGNESLLSPILLVQTSKNNPPSAIISATSTSGEAPLSVIFDGSGSSDSDGTITRYAWDFDDGNSGASEAMASHIFTQAGTYVVRLTVTDDSGATDKTSVTITTSEPSAPSSDLGFCEGFYAEDFALIIGKDEQPIPPLAEPAKGEPFSDPTYGTCITRATDHENEPPVGFARHAYSRRQAFNATTTRFISFSGNGYWHLYDANTLAYIKQLNGPGGDAEIQWHPTDPERFYYMGNHGGLQLREYNISDDTTQVVGDFSGRLPWPTAARVWTKSEGSPSADGRYWGFQVETSDFQFIGLMVWDLETDTILGTWDSADAGRPDHVSMSPTGDFIVVSWNDWQRGEDGYGTTVFNRDFSSRLKVHHKSVHSDIALLSNGHDAFVAVDYQTNSGDVFFVDLQAGMETGKAERVVLFYAYNNGTSSAFHFSGKAFNKPGWVLISSYGSATSEWLHRKVFAVSLEDSPTIANIAHHHSGPDGYWTEPQATVNRDFTRILFASNWESGADRDVDDYMILLPNDVLNSDNELGTTAVTPGGSQP